MGEPKSNWDWEKEDKLLLSKNEEVVYVGAAHRMPSGSVSIFQLPDVLDKGSILGKLCLSESKTAASNQAFIIQSKMSRESLP